MLANLNSSVKVDYCKKQPPVKKRTAAVLDDLRVCILNYSLVIIASSGPTVASIIFSKRFLRVAFIFIISFAVFWKVFYFMA